ncbi:MAG TPA: P-loop NTPase fold protein, partial [Polyangiales bacterium]|nr:P-loop NTPase fold protein [Polyangiales bacterium]
MRELNAMPTGEDVRARLAHIRTRPLRMLTELGVVRTVIFALLILVVPGLLAWGIERCANSNTVTQLLFSLSSLVAILGAALRTGATTLGRIDQALTRVSDAYDKATRSNASVINEQQQLEIARREEHLRSVELANAERKLGLAQEAVTEASIPAQVLQTIARRTDEMSYSKELTSLSLARSDLEHLSNLLQQTNAERSHAAGSGLKHIDRVILYIDDLDRCRPSEVVRVLQLVHMLLAFELFVVVVAVDARWVSHALLEQYSWLKKHGSSEQSPTDPNMTQHPEHMLSTEDYLEKIFQVTFWLEPMTAGRTASYLASLVHDASEKVEQSGTLTTA